MSTQFRTRPEAMPPPPDYEAERQQAPQAPERETADVKTLLEQADESVAQFEADGLPAAQQIAEEFGTQVDEETERKLKELDDQVRVAREVLGGNLKGKISNKVVEIAGKIAPDSSVTEYLRKSQTDKIAVEGAYKLWQRLNQSPRVYAVDKDISSDIEAYRRIKPFLQKSIRGHPLEHTLDLFQGWVDPYIEHIAKQQGPVKAVEVYESLPPEFIVFEKNAMRASHHIYEQARLEAIRAPGVKTDKDANKVMMERFKDHLDVLALGAYWNSRSDHNFNSADKVQFIKFLDETGKYPEMIANYSKWDFSEEDWKDNRELLFKAYQAYQPDKIVFDLDNFGDLFEKLPTDDQDSLIKKLFDQKKGYILLERLDGVTALRLTDEQKDTLLKGSGDDWIAHVLRKDQNLEKLGVTKDQVLEAVVEQGQGRLLLDEFNNLGLSEEQKSAVVNKISQIGQIATLWQHFEDIKPHFNESKIRYLIENSLIPENSVAAAEDLLKVADKVALTDQDKKKLVKILLEKDQNASLLVYYPLLHLSHDETLNILVELSLSNPKAVLAKFDWKTADLSAEESNKMKKFALSGNPDAFISSWGRLNLTEGERKEFAQELYIVGLKNRQYNQLGVIKYTTEIELEYTQDMEAIIKESLAHTKPSEYHRTADTLQAQMPAGVTVPKPAWGLAYDRLVKLQARSENATYDPWITDLDTLVETSAHSGGPVEEQILDVQDAKDGEILYDFVHNYGMYNLPNILKWHAAITRAKDVSDIPPPMRQEISQCLNINIEQLPNKGFVSQEIRKFRQRIQEQLLTDQVPDGMRDNQAALELFLALKGSTGWERNDSPQQIIDIWQETARKHPDKARLREGYHETSFEVPLVSRRQEATGESQQREAKEAELLGNKELQTSIQKLFEAYKSVDEMSDTSSWWNRQRAELNAWLRQEVSDLSDKMKTIDNDRARGSMQKQLDLHNAALDKISAIQAPDTRTNRPGLNADIVQFIEQLIERIPKKFSNRESLIRQSSALLASRIMPEGQFNPLRARLAQPAEPLAPADAVLWRDHLVDYMAEHFLHSEQKEHHTGHSPFSKDTLKELQFMWGTKDLKNNIIVQSEQKLKNLRETGVVSSGKTMEVSMIPVKGMLRIYSGDLGDACYTSRHGEFANGNYPGITALIFVTGRGTNEERLRGSVLAVETKTAQGEPVLVVRANNPQENLLNQVDSSALIAETLEQMKQLAARRNIKKVVIPRDRASASCSNRSKVANYYDDHFKQAPKIGLVNEAETNFNGYKVWDVNGDHPVAEIT